MKLNSCQPSCRLRTIYLLLLAITGVSITWTTNIFVNVASKGRVTVVGDFSNVSTVYSTTTRGTNDVNFLCMFTTFKPAAERLRLHQNVLFNWKSLALKRRVRPIIYYDSVSETNSSGDAHAIKTILDMARLIGWETYDFPRKSSSGLPYFKDMFFDAARRIPDCLFYAYSNGDIMFNDGLLDTLDGILQVIGKFNPVLLVGQRTNVDRSYLNDGETFLPHAVQNMGHLHGHLLHDNAQDYFIVYNNSFPWHVIPDLVIGRVAYDNFVVAKAIATNVSVIDVTKTVVALHQSDSEGDRAGHSKNLTEKDINKAVIGKFDYDKGRLIYTRYYTDFVTVAGDSSAKLITSNSEVSSSHRKVGVFARKSESSLNKSVRRRRIRGH